MKDTYIPVEVIQDNKKTIWQMDITNLRLEELIKLKSTLNGLSVNAIDSVIYSKTCSATFSGQMMKERKEKGKSLIRKKTKRRNENKSKMKRR